MIRFVDLRPAEIAGVRFAFWDTVRDRFVQGLAGEQGWGTWREFVEDMPGRITGTPHDCTDRFLGLVPFWAHSEMPEAEEQGVPL